MFLGNKGIDNDQAAELAARSLTSEGLLRLDDGILRDRISILANGLVRLDERTCAEFAGGHLSEPTIRLLYQQISPQALERLAAIHGAAALAQIRRSPARREVTSDQLLDAWTKLLDAGPAVVRTRAFRILQDLSSASQVDRCWIAKLMFDAAAGRSPEAAVLTRALLLF
jgi:hypothetical protein